MKKISLLIWLIILTFSCKLHAQVSPQNNIISVDITQPQNASYTYDSAFTNCYSLGMRDVGLHFLWKTSLEPTPNNYTFNFLDIANIYYPSKNTPVDLNIDPVETNQLEFPTDLSALPLDDPAVIARFKTLLDSVFAHIPNLQLSSLSIGSEVDIYLGTDAAKWAQYTNLYIVAAGYARTLRPGLKVSCECTLPGINAIQQSNFIQTLNFYSDVIGVSYYPLNTNFTVKNPSVVASDLASLVSQYPSQPIYFYQLGYPSSTSCNSSEALQAQFIEQVFTTWDTYASKIKMIDFTWMHDWDTAKVNFYANYYGITDTTFLEFLHTLGLRTWNNNGTDKAAMRELRCQAKQRGFNALNIICPTSIDEDETATKPLLELYPNPTNDKFMVRTSIDLHSAELKLCDGIGHLVKSQRQLNGHYIEISSKEMAEGIYIITLTTEGEVLQKKFVVQH